MRLLIVAAALSISAAATPAIANEARLEARGGIAWANGSSTETIGVALGYDAPVGENTFVGVEAVLDTDFDISDPVLGANLRFGFNMSPESKLFATLGYAHDTGFDQDDAVIGAGYQHNVGARSLVSIQYQRYLDSDINRATIGFGYRF